MCGRDDQPVDEHRVQDPEEVAETVGAQPGSTSFGRQRQGRAEDLDVVPLVGFPDPNADVDVLGKVDQDAGEFADRLGRQSKCVVGEALLGFGESLLELPYDGREMEVALAFVSLGSMCRVVHHDISFPCVRLRIVSGAAWAWNAAGAKPVLAQGAACLGVGGIYPRAPKPAILP